MEIHEHGENEEGRTERDGTEEMIMVSRAWRMDE